MPAWLAITLAVIGFIGSGGGIVALINVRAQRQQLEAKADETVAGTVKVLLGSATELVEPLERQLTQANIRAEQLAGRLAQAERRTAQLERRLHNLVDLIHDPYMTLERLRTTVAPNPNGH